MLLRGSWQGKMIGWQSGNGRSVVTTTVQEPAILNLCFSLLRHKMRFSRLQEHLLVCLFFSSRLIPVLATLALAIWHSHHSVQRQKVLPAFSIGRQISWSQRLDLCSCGQLYYSFCISVFSQLILLSFPLPYPYKPLTPESISTLQRSPVLRPSCCCHKHSGQASGSCYPIHRSEEDSFKGDFSQTKNWQVIFL